MNPQDDPEARIRALEPTELGAENTAPPAYSQVPPPLPPTQQWPQQAPYTQPNYGQPQYGQPYDQNTHGQSTYNQDPYNPGPYNQNPYDGAYPTPYPPGPPQTGSGFQPWMVIVPIVVVVMVLAAGAAVFFLSASTSSPDSPGIAGGGDVLTNRPEAPQRPSIPQLPALPTDIQIPSGTVELPSDSTPEPGGTVAVSGIGTNKTIACNDNIVIISGANNTVEVTGHCTAITVSGFENVITAESTAEIAVSGFDNKITYRTGDPTVNESGSGNSITRE